MSAEAFQQIEDLLGSLSRDEKVRLVGLLARQLTEERPAEPISLRGAWKGKFPEDFDLDAALKEIRTEWEGEMEDIINGRPPR